MVLLCAVFNQVQQKKLSQASFVFVSQFLFPFQLQENPAPVKRASLLYRSGVTKITAPGRYQLAGGGRPHMDFVLWGRSAENCVLNYCESARGWGFGDIQKYRKVLAVPVAVSKAQDVLQELGWASRSDWLYGACSEKLECPQTTFILPILAPEGPVKQPVRGSLAATGAAGILTSRNLGQAGVKIPAPSMVFIKSGMALYRTALCVVGMFGFITV